jgi:glutathione S-transferase
MKLYGTPMTCSLAAHIALFEAGFDAQYYPVDLARKQLRAGGDYRAINAKGYVPALVLDDGTILTEVPAVLQYIADQAPQSGLAPVAGSLERYRLMEWLTYLSAEVHKKVFWYFFAPYTPPEAKQFAKKSAAGVFSYLNEALSAQTYLLGDQFTVADAYLFTILNWCRAAEIDLSPYAALQAFHARAMTRPHVARAFEVEMALRQQAA